MAAQSKESDKVKVSYESAASAPELLEALQKIRAGARSMCLHLNLKHRDFSNKDHNIVAADSIENEHGRALADWYFELAECIRVAEAAIDKETRKR
jgi:hypothetical protein